MEPAKIKISIGEFQVTEIKFTAFRIALGQGVNIWIHLSFEHNVIPGDYITLLAEIPHALTRPASE